MENPTLELFAKNKYLYKQEEMRDLCVTASLCADKSVVTVTSGAKYSYEKLGDTFQSYIDNKLNLCATEDVRYISASYPEIKLERRPGSVLITAGMSTYSAPVEMDKLGINRTAAPYVTTFKPQATRYELDADALSSFKKTLASMYTPETVYRVSKTGSDAPEFNYLTTEYLCQLTGVTPLYGGNAVSKHKNIKLFKLDNGIGVKLDNEGFCTITKADPKYNTASKVFIKQQNPDDKRVYLEPVKVKVSKGFNPTLKQFAYDIVMDNGNKIYDVPESDLTVETFTVEPTLENEVPTSHF